MIGRQAPQRPARRGKSTNSSTASGRPCGEHLDGAAERRAPAAAHARRAPAAARARLSVPPSSDDGGNRRGRGEQRLAVEERRHDQQAREADDQRAVAKPARLEILDADQHEQERDGGIAADEIAHTTGGSRSRWRPRTARAPTTGCPPAACRDAARRARSARSASRRATVPRPAIQSGRYASLGSCVASSSAPSQRSLADRQRVVAAAACGARRCFLKNRCAPIGHRRVLPSRLLRHERERRQRGAAMIASLAGGERDARERAARTAAPRARRRAPTR